MSDAVTFDLAIGAQKGRGRKRRRIVSSASARPSALASDDSFAPTPEASDAEDDAVVFAEPDSILSERHLATSVSEIQPEAARERIGGRNGSSQLARLVERRQAIAAQNLDEDGAYRADVAQCPEAGTEEDYARVPVESFGESMLKRMGWDGKASAEEVKKGPVGRLTGGEAQTAPVMSSGKRGRSGDGARGIGGGYGAVSGRSSGGVAGAESGAQRSALNADKSREEIDEVKSERCVDESSVRDALRVEVERRRSEQYRGSRDDASREYRYQRGDVGNASGRGRYERGDVNHASGRDRYERGGVDNASGRDRYDRSNADYRGGEGGYGDESRQHGNDYRRGGDDRRQYDYSRQSGREQQRDDHYPGGSYRERRQSSESSWRRDQHLGSGKR